MNEKQKKVIAIAIAAAIVPLGYILSPADLIPDLIPGLGLIDDIIVLMFGGGTMAYATHLYRQHGTNPYLQDNQDGYEPMSKEQLDDL